VNTSLFDVIDRTDTGPAAYAEPHFRYWNRSARKDIGLVRDVLEHWFARYPAEHARELRSRIRGDDTSYNAGVFELLLHETLLLLGCSLEVHPSVPNSNRRPEFRVTEPDGSTWYLEATVASGESKEEATVRTLKNRIYDALNEVECTDYFINIEIEHAERTPLPVSRLKAFVRQQLDAHAPAPWRFESGQWVIVLGLLPRGEKSRSRTGVRPLGIQFFPIHVIKSAEAIRESVRAKAKRYGNLDAPFVVAVNALCEHVDEHDEIDALFGDLGPYGRYPNGAWQDVRGPRNTRVSGVFIASRFEPWKLATSEVRLYHHPDAAMPYRGVLTRFPQSVVVEGRVTPTDGLTLRELFNVDPGWLNVDDDD
jgi:hypothetical protein